MDENIFYSETKFIIDTVINTAIDVIGTPKRENITPEPNVERQVGCLYYYITLYIVILPYILGPSE